jgi:hypothetical protein
VAGSPERAVTLLLDALAASDHPAAVVLTVPDQWPVVALVEGMPIEDALSADPTVWEEVGTNFWEAFATRLEELTGGTVDRLQPGTAELFTARGTRFAVVEVADPERTLVRRFYVKEGDGWRIDVVATFAGALAGKIPQVAQQLRSHPEGGDLLDVLRRQAPSLEAVLAVEDDPALRQGATAALLELQR